MALTKIQPFGINSSSTFTFGNVSATGNVTGTYILGNGSQLTGLPEGYANADVAAYLPTYTGNLASLTGAVTTTANITGAYILGNGSQLTGLPEGYTNSNVAAYLPTYTGNLASLTGAVVTTANVSGNYFIGNGSQLTSITGANVTGTVASATTAGTVTDAAQPNITSVGTLTSVSVTGNISGNYFIGNGSQLTGLPEGYTNANVAAYLPTYTGNLASLAGNVTTTSNISGNYFIGNGSALNSITGANVTGTVASATTAATVTTAEQPNITSVGTLSSVSVSGNVVGGNLITAGLTSTGTLQTSGNAIVGGNLVVNGNTVYINITELNVQDPIIGLGRGANNAPLTTNDGKDRGTEMWYYDTAERAAFVGFDNSTGKLIAAANVSIADEIVTVNNYGTFVAGAVESTTVSASGNVSGGNAIISGIIQLPNNTVIKSGSVNSVAFGNLAGDVSQGIGAVAIGPFAGSESQGNVSVAIGSSAGRMTQGAGAVAVGINAGLAVQSAGAVAIGVQSGFDNQGLNAVAIGLNAGQGSQGANSVAIGALAGNTSQATNSIIINATGAVLDSTVANTFTVSPVRNDVANIGQVMFYNTASKEITYGNTISVAGNVAGNFFIGNGSQLTGISRITWTTQANAAPSSPAPGDFWYDAYTGVKYQYINDGTSNVWVDQSYPTSFSTLAVSGNASIGGHLVVAGNATADFFVGTATQAQYADLAEIYQPDQAYEPGTVLVFGGEHEVTVSTVSHDTRVAGVVSTAPAYLMNSQQSGIPVALTGRVPCRVRGPVAKGEQLVNIEPGIAGAVDFAQYRPGCVIGKSLENIEDSSVHTIEIAVGRY